MTGIKRLLVPKMLFASLLLSGLLLPMSSFATVRDTISINQGWQFHRGDVKNISELKTTQSGDDVVNLPHDFLIGQDWVAPDASERPDNSDAGSNVRSRLSSRGFKEMGIGWYRYELTPKDEWRGKRIVLDFQGIMLVDELYDKWLTQYAGGRVDWESLWQKDIPEWVKRDRNHPSVILWSLGNELQQYSNLPFNDWGVTAYKLQKELLHRYDDTRLTTVAIHPRYRNLETDSIPADLAVATEVNSYNYRYMYFPGDMKRYPEKTFYQSEASVAAMGPNFYEMDRDKVLGLSYWGAIDYLGESMGWPIKGWNQGVFDLSLQPKPDAYFVKSMFSEEPVVHIGIIEKSGGNIQWNGINVSAGKLSENWNREAGEQVSLYTYTNADEVELFLNGKSLGVRKNSNDPKLRARIKWDNIAYAPGTLVAVAKKNGKVVARHQIETTGEAVALKQVPDMETWHADGKDLMHVRIYAVDKKGRRVMNVKDAKAFDKLTFTVKGDANIVAVDNGNIASDELHIGKTQLEKTIQRHLYQGSALVILRAGDKPGKIELSVAGEKMKAKKLVLNTK